MKSKSVNFLFIIKQKLLEGIGKLSVKKSQFLNPGKIQIEKPYKVWGCIRFLIDGIGHISIKKNFHAVSNRNRSYLTLFSPCHLTVIDNGKIEIEEGVGLNGVTIAAKGHVFIGARTMIAANTIIMDFDGHIAWPSKERRINPGPTRPVVIQEDVWIGLNCVILKGVTIGRDAVIGPNSVVIRDVEPGCLYAGNPARKIKDYKV